MVQELESRIQQYLGVKHCICVCNATIGLELLQRALNLNGEVIIPSFTFIATAHSLRWQRLDPVFCDIRMEDHLIDPTKIEELITPRTSAIMAVPIWGQPCDYSALQAIADKHDLKLIFDSAHAFGCKSEDQYLGGFGDAEVFSFHATKSITTGEGGMILADNSAIAKKIRLFRSHGVDKERYKHLVHGHNFRLSNLLASIGYSQSKRIDELNKKRLNLYILYLKHLDLNKIKQQNFYNNKKIIPWTFALTLKKGLNVNKLSIFLYKNKIETRLGFFSPSRLKLYKVKKNLYSSSDYLSKNIICLPFFLGLKEKEIKYICSKINYFLNS